MSESRYLKMRVFSTILTVCFCFELSVQLKEQTDISQTTIAPYYSYDQQIRGFNGTKLTSGPIIIADKRTLFISDLNYQNSEKIVEFWAGFGSPFGSQKQLVFRQVIAYPLNLYVILPDNLSLDDIDYLQAISKNESLDYVIFEKVNKTSLRNYDHRNAQDTVFRIPKCCLPNEYLNFTMQDCSEALIQTNLDINIFESNKTGLDPDVKLKSSEYKLVPYYRDLQCNENGYKTVVDTVHGLIYNSSLIIQGIGIFSHGEYCIDVLANDSGVIETAVLHCYYQTIATAGPDFYLPVLILSAIAFALSAIAYGIIIKAKSQEVYKVYNLYFIIYFWSMFVAFTSLIIMQVQQNNVACNFFGFVFVFTMVSSFFWLLLVCLELLYLVIYPLQKQKYDQRSYWCIGIALGLSLLIFSVSLFSGQIWVPDVPLTFITNYRGTGCVFETTYRRSFIIFVPLIVSILGSIASLIAVKLFINKNQANKHIANHYDWTKNYQNYTFHSRSHFIIIVVASFWLLDIFFYTQSENGKAQLFIDVIKAALGVVTCIAFVANKYRVNDIKSVLCKEYEPVNRQPVTEDTLGFNNGISTTPDTPREMHPLVAHSNNLNTTQNNR